MLYIFCAMKCEASPLIQSLKLRLSPDNKNAYLREGITLLVTGIGPERMAGAIKGLSPLQGSRFLNAGICGCRDSSVPVCSAFLVNEIRDNKGGIPYYPDMLVNTTLAEAGCTSYGSMKTDLDCPTLLADMECHAFFKGCLVHADTASVHAVKVVSDHMDPSGLTKNDVSRMMNSASKQITEYVQSLLRIPVPLPYPDYSEYYDAYRFTESMRIELDRLNVYHMKRYGSLDIEEIYGNHGIPSGKKDSMRIFNVIKERLL